MVSYEVQQKMSAQCGLDGAAMQEFARALDAPLLQAPTPSFDFPSTFKSLSVSLPVRPILLSLLSLFAAFSLLLLLRPPFVMIFDIDELRPWRGTKRVSWISVAIVSSLAAGVPWAVWTLHP